jgi:hypothetical protein
MPLFDDLRMYARFGFGLRRFLREPITVAEARTAIRRRLAEREDNFFRVLKRGIFEYPRSPYLPLLRLAGCTLEDIAQLVRSRGLERALLTLREAGVYVTFEECKGRAPIVRGGKEFPVSAHDFDNPWHHHHYYAESGGSTGAGTRVHHDLDHLAVRATHDAVTYHAHGVLDAPVGVWRGVLPDGSGLNTTLALCRCGRPPARWFTPGTSRGLKPSLLKFRAANYLAVALGRASGVRIPWPEHMPIEDAGRIAMWAAEIVRKHRKCSLAMVASRALRVSLAARKEGIDLSGVTFVIAGEPVTPAKIEGIRASGASYFPTYGYSEAGRLGRGCCHPVSSNDLHLITDLCALITYPRQVGGIDVPAFNVTSLLPTAPKILLNAESDDYGILEERSCGCPLEEIGYKTHIREIRSFRKLTGEGVTLLGIDLLHILEKVLPERFGGSPLDYQLIEEEDKSGFTRVVLAVSPSVSIADESEVIQTMLHAMRQDGPGGGVASDMWSQSGNLQIRRMNPIVTARGKLLPLYLPGRNEAAGEPGHRR